MKRKPHRFLLYLLLELASLIIIILPYRISIFLGSLLGGIAYEILPKYRNITLHNLRQAFTGEKDDVEIKRIARDVFRNLGITAAEFLSLRKFNRERIKRFITEEDIRPLREVLSKEKGAIIVASHFGNWELSAICGAAYGLDVTVIARRIYYPLYNRFLVSLRSSKGVKTLYRDDEKISRKSLDVLRSNKVLAIVPDQDVDSVEGIFVNFFGQPAHTPTGPVKLAMLSGAPISPAFMYRKGRRFHYVIEEPIYAKGSGDRKRDIAEYTQKWTDVVERYIRMEPSQWVWVHKRWKRKPTTVSESQR